MATEYTFIATLLQPPANILLQQIGLALILYIE
jgi:hypothetical protein